MALHEFLEHHRAEILRLTHSRIAESSPRGSESELIDSIPEVFDDIVAALREDVGLTRETVSTAPGKTPTVHGRQRLRLGFSITELVHDYGALCHAITGLAEETTGITPREYRILNRELDGAIAAAVSEYAGQRELDRDRRHDQRACEHLGFVAHELRNALAAAMLSFDVIKRGEVGVAGKVGNMLERSLRRAQDLIDRSLAEVRSRSDVQISRELTILRDLLEDVEVTTAPDAEAKHTYLVIEGASTCEVYVDRALITSAVANLVQNAIKYSPAHAEIHVHCTIGDGLLTIEVADQCGGLPEERLSDLFDPFVRGHTDTTGMGLGLPITRQAIEAHGGHIHVHNHPGKGCVFSVELPT